MDISQKSKKCIERLRHNHISANKPDLSSQPTAKVAAVLVLLYERAGELRVLLTTRSKALRSHPGQTAFPGGKFDDADLNFVQTAYREANEEVSLPLASPHIHTLCTLEPFISKYRLLVIPVIALLTDLSILDALKASEAEVDHIFDHPLHAILDPTLASTEPLVDIGSEDWPYEVEYHNWSDTPTPWSNDSLYRMHRFRTTASPVKGLTADILIKTAEIAYGQDPSYQRYASTQPMGFAAICKVLAADSALTSAPNGTHHSVA